MPQDVYHDDWVRPEISDFEGCGRGVAGKQVTRSMSPDLTLRAQRVRRLAYLHLIVSLQVPEGTMMRPTFCLS